MPTLREIANQRLHNQHLVGAPFERPEDVVRWLCAVQAQDYTGAKWGISQRTASATSEAIDRLFAEGAILRTHVLRPTWHFVMPADIRWLLDLTAPRVHAANASYYRKLELDDALFRQSNELLAAALRGGKHLTRTELAAVLHDGGIVASGPRLAYLLMRAELDAVVCSGALRGKQFTYALLDERVPRFATLGRDEALAELTRRYFASHGPATAHDFAWWSGLTVADAKSGIEIAGSFLVREVVDDTPYWFAAPTTAVNVTPSTVHLLPNYDEYLIAYKDHTASFDPSVLNSLVPDDDALMAHIVVVDGLVVGGWRRIQQRREVMLSTKLLVGLSRTEENALKVAAEGYGRFIGLPAKFA